MKKIFLLLFCCSAIHLFSQPSSKPAAGFSAIEYEDVLHLGFKGFSDSFAIQSDLHYHYQHVFTSPEVGLRNKCAMYLRNDGIAVINLRGTVNHIESWLENFFAGMIKAEGYLQLNDSTRFDYKVAANGKAYVHAGWMIGLGFLSPYINHFMDSMLLKGTRGFIVCGHSQGGALAFLTTSYLYYKYAAKYPDMQLKAYCSAAPKPGNLYYAYDFDFITRNGYAFRVANTADWVPETPISIQTLDDLNDPNPVKNAKPVIKKQKFFVRLYLNHIYNKMKNGSNTAMERYRKHLGKDIYKQIKKALPQLQQPDFVYSSNYMTAGTPIILYADSTYYQHFPFDGKNYFVHHSLNPYLYLLHEFYKTTP